MVLFSLLSTIAQSAKAPNPLKQPPRAQSDKHIVKCKCQKCVRLNRFRIKANLVTRSRSLKFTYTRHSSFQATALTSFLAVWPKFWCKPLWAGYKAIMIKRFWQRKSSRWEASYAYCERRSNSSSILHWTIWKLLRSLLWSILRMETLLRSDDGLYACSA